MALVLISLGSNLGDRFQNLKSAGEHLQSRFTVEHAAPVYETPPYGFKKQNYFYNSAITIKTSLPPEALLKVLLDIEKIMGRVRKIKWGPRIIDIDIIFYDNQIIETPQLQIPHPDFKNRVFVLEPAAQLMESFIPPGGNKTLGQILIEFRKQNPSDQINKVVERWMHV